MHKVEPLNLQSGNLLHNLTLFGRLLRGLGLDVNPGRMLDVVQSFDHINIGSRQDFYYSLRGLLVQKKEELPLFDEAFDRFWREPGFDVTLAEVMDGRLPQKDKPEIMPASLPSNDPPPSQQETPDEDDDIIIEITQTYSIIEILRQKDFAELSHDELAAIKQLMAQIVWQMGQRRTRRQQMGEGKTIDLRRTLRHSFRYGGEILEWPRRKPKIKPRPLVIIADVSGSMERYSRILLHFSYGLTRSLEQRVEAFVFSTRLSRITRPLRNRNIDHALAEAAHAIPDWSSGTRIGEALKRFNFDWGRRVLRGGAIVLLISDGWDRGDPELLGQEMRRLQRSCHRLIWLNPLLGSDSYEPLTRGMVTALPYVDDFLPVHNLASLEELAGLLAKIIVK